MGRPLVQTDCIDCGNCVDACPTAALEFKSLAQNRVPYERTKTLCSLCSELCEVEVVKNLWGYSVRPNSDEEGVRQVLCALGRYGIVEQLEGDRLSEPMIRRDGHLLPCSWDEALEAAAAGLSRVKEAHGGQALLLTGGGDISCQEGKALGALSSHLGAHGGHLASLASGAELYALDGLYGDTRSTASYQDLEQAGVILALGADPMESSNAMAASIRRAHRAGAQIIVLSSKPGSITELSHHWLHARRGSSGLVLGWMLAELLKERTDLEPELHALQRTFSSITGDRLVREARVAPARAMAALEALRGARGPIIATYDQGTRSERSPDDLLILAELLELLEVKGSGLLLSSSPNLEGLRRGGLLPHGAQEAQLLKETIQSGGIHGAWILREDPDQSPELAGALDKLKFLVVSDLYMSATAQRADVLLPASTHLETGGAFVRKDGAFFQVEACAAPRVERSLEQQIHQMGAQLGQSFAPFEPQAAPPISRRAWPLPAPQLKHHNRIQDALSTAHNELSQRFKDL